VNIRCIANPGCRLGEGPIWDAGSQRLFWVDILDRRIYRHDPARGDVESWSTPEEVGFVLPERDGTVLAGFATGLHRVTLRAGERTSVERLDRVDGERFNDATRGPDGAIWACTLATYYRYDDAFRRRTVDDGYGVANGPALSPDGRLLYTVETLGHAGRRSGVYVSLVAPGGELESQRLLVDWAGNDSQPDGIVADRDGSLWVGEFHGNVLHRFSPEGDELAAIALPAWNVTKAAVAGDRLYVTSARFGVDAGTLARFPNTGGVLEITGIGSRG
jgi:sugar lactone lactonase YvrE